MIHKNGMDCSCAGFGVGLLSVHLYSGVFSGPSKTMDSTQFHVLFLYSAILPPEPKLEYRIGENILVPLFLNEITFCQHTLVACDGLCTAQFIFPHYGDGVEAVFTIGYSTKHGSLGSSQVTLAGRTGAGKSTILKLLLGLYEPQGGEVLIHGRPAAAVREEEKRKLFGYVEQTFHMVPGTVRDQITLYDETIPADRVKAVAELTGLDDVIESSENGYDTKCTPELFSQGQWQLLSIARAAVAEPQMLLFDEITANLDAETEKAVLLALKRVAKDRTVISISHRTSAELGRIIYL